MNEKKSTLVEILMDWLSGLDANWLSDVFIVSTLVLFGMALYATARGRHQPFIQFAPTLLTSVGILGTFVGISVGLANFKLGNQAEIDQSIPALLAGLKMAFITSVVGMSTSLVAKSFATWIAKRSESQADGVGAGEILLALEAQQEALLDLRRAIAGEGDASVVTQLQKVRSDIQDGLKDTRRLLGPEGQKSVAERLEGVGTELRTMGKILDEDMKDLTREADARQQALLDLRRAIAGEGDASVVTQLQKVRADLQDGLRDTRRLLGPEGQMSVGERLDGLGTDLRTLGKALDDDMKDLARQAQAQQQRATQGLELLERTRLAIAGEGDTSLVTQIQRARTDAREGFAAALEKLTDLGSVQGRVVEELQAARAVQDRTLAVLGEGPGSVLELLRAGQQSLDLAMADVRADLKDFAQKVSELGSRALIEALSDVIRDFNQKLTEQFGDNFRRLDDAVGRLLEWQDNYKGQMADMKAGLEQAVASLQASRDALAEVRSHADAIPGLIGRLEDVVTAAYVQLDDLQRHLQAFAEVRDRAVKAVPEITEVLDRSFAEMNRAVTAASAHYQALLTGAKDYIDRFATATQSFQKNFTQETDHWLDLVTTALKDGTGEITAATSATEQALTALSSKVASSADGVAAQVEAAIGGMTTSVKATVSGIDATVRSEVSRLGTALEKTVTGLDASLQSNNARLQAAVAKVMSDLKTALEGAVGKMQESASRVVIEQASQIKQLGADLRQENARAAQDRTDLLNQEIKALDQAMQAEIGRVMQAMANHLVTITNKFVQDYAQLTRAMAEVVGQARGIPPPGGTPGQSRGVETSGAPRR